MSCDIVEDFYYKITTVTHCIGFSTETESIGGMCKLCGSGSQGPRRWLAADLEFQVESEGLGTMRVSRVISSQKAGRLETQKEPKFQSRSED